MAEHLYTQYERLYLQQAELCEESAVAGVRSALAGFSRQFLQILRSVAVPRQSQVPGLSTGNSSNSQGLTRVQEEIEAACDSAQRQIVTALANGFGVLANLPLPPALDTPTNQPSVSGTSRQAVVSQEADDTDDDSMSIKSEDTSECESDCESYSDEIEIKEEAIEENTNEITATAVTSIVSSNNVNVSVKTEIESECDSSDSDSSDDEEELVDGRGIKEEIDDEHSNDQIIGNSGNENDGMQMLEQEENDTIDNINPSDYNFETTDSHLVNSNETNSEQQSDAMMIDGDEASNQEGDDEPAIIVVNYEEFEMQSIGNPNNQSTVAEGSLNDESDNIAEPDGDFVETANSNGDDNEQLSEALMIEANSQRNQAGPPIVSNQASTSTRRSARVSAVRNFNYAEVVENSLVGQQGTLTVTRHGKHSIRRSGKSTAPKRARIVPAPAVAVEENVGSGEEAIKLSIIVRRLKCPVPRCKKVFPSKVQLDGHLLVKHAIQKYGCKVKDCTESYATRGELTRHRNSLHDNLDKDWPCGQCEVTCNNYNDLVIHVYRYHEYGLFACSADKCDYTETTRIKVKHHQQTHLPAKHHCTFARCSSSFNHKSHLTTHLRVHSKEKPFLCSQCPMAFAQKINLTAHEKIHSGFKPYSCTWAHCDYSASKQSNVIRHVRGVHFGLPRSQTEQAKRGIIDERDARVFLKTVITSN